MRGRLVEDARASGDKMMTWQIYQHGEATKRLALAPSPVVAVSYVETNHERNEERRAGEDRVVDVFVVLADGRLPLGPLAATHEVGDYAVQSERDDREGLGHDARDDL